MVAARITLMVQVVISWRKEVLGSSPLGADDELVTAPVLVIHAEWFYGTEAPLAFSATIPSLFT